MPVPMSILLPLACALAMGLITRPVLRGLPRPSEAPDYAALARPGFAIGVGALTFVAASVACWLASPPTLVAWLGLATVGVLSVSIDARTTWLPLRLARWGWVLAAAGVVVAAISAGDAGLLAAGAAGTVAVGGLFHLLWAWSRGLGYGDVRLMATVGAVTALEGAMFAGWSVFAGTLLGAVWGLVHTAIRGRGVPFPYGPALLAGPFVMLALRPLLA